jgi:ketosteroid isomerase-like protein
MRLRSLAALLAVTPLLAACAAGAGPITQADRDAIDAVRTAFRDAVQAGDVAGMLATYTDDVVEMPPNMPMRSGKAAAEAAASSEPQASEFTLIPLETEGVGDLAYDRGTFSFMMSVEGMPEPMTETGKYVVLLRKQPDGSWLMSALIWNSDTPLPETETEM